MPEAAPRNHKHDFIIIIFMNSCCASFCDHRSAHDEFVVRRIIQLLPLTFNSLCVVCRELWHCVSLFKHAVHAPDRLLNRSMPDLFFKPGLENQEVLKNIFYVSKELVSVFLQTLPL